MKPIDADKLIEELLSCLYNPEEFPVIGLGTVLSIIDNQPEIAAQHERKKGHWIRHEYADIVEGYYVPNYECSECHSWKRDDSDFCPDCGTDMR